ncbi:hypothetical protein, partial [Rhodococcus sp. MS16]|uniref:hypothetical protein n=1 Tax=Rhodococcus sp. MS16 TaxID=2579941 RepID=UPI001A92D195
MKGEEAATALTVQTSCVASSVAYLNPRQKVRFLREVLDFVRARGSADGNETIIAAAINGAWPWLSFRSLESTIRYIGLVLGRSKFTDEFSTYVVDPNMRTATFLGAGELKKAQLTEWFIGYQIHVDEWRLNLAKRVDRRYGERLGGADPLGGLW